MNILFSIGIGIFPEQRVSRWQMVSRLFHALGTSFQQLGHQVYFICHPEAMVEEIPPNLVWVAENHDHFDYLLEKFLPDYVFVWNGSSPGDLVTSAIATAHGARMVFAEQGWMPQKDTLYFDLAGCNGKCSTQHKKWSMPKDQRKLQMFMEKRREFVINSQAKMAVNLDMFKMRRFDLSRPIFVPLQDERDLNIIIDSPFKTMANFLSYLQQCLPNLHFHVRPHPKYPNPRIDSQGKITILDPKKSMFSQLTQCGGVIGINSTALIEAAMLEFPVVALGRGLATETGLFLECSQGQRIDAEYLQSYKPNNLNASGILYHLLCEKQFFRADLSDPSKVLQSNFFRDIVRLKNWNIISR